MKPMLALLVALLLAAAPVLAAGTPPSEKEAIAAAQAWLEIVDKGDYPESWKQAAEYFRGAVSSDNWVQAVGGVRKPLGKMLSRKVKSAKLTHSLPGAPDGTYVVIMFESSFEQKAAAVETLTPMLEKDGKWRVSGYFVR
jgi:hypothetical protein